MNGYSVYIYNIELPYVGSNVDSLITLIPTVRICIFK